MAHSVDCVIFGYGKGKIKLLLIKRGAEPYKGDWAIPGDLVYPDENLNDAANRVLNELTQLDHIFLDQVGTLGEVGRHPLGRVITTAFYALVNIEDYEPKASFWAENLNWFDLDEIKEIDLPFDHDSILQLAFNKLEFMVRHQPVGFKLLPNKFSLSELRELYEELLDEKYDKSNFRKKVLSMGILKRLEENKENVAHRPAALYEFDTKKYAEQSRKGLTFNLG